MRYSKIMNRKSGFTLIELLVVIIILGVLITVALVSFLSSQKKSRDVKRKNDLRQVSIALEAYYNDRGRYPAGDSLGRIEGCAPDGQTACEWGEAFEDENGTVYMVNLPTEPTSEQVYFYMANAAGSQYQLYARLENTLDSEIPQSADASRAFADTACESGVGTLYCNYGVSSANIQVEEGRTVVYE